VKTIRPIQLKKIGRFAVGRWEQGHIPSPPSRSSTFSNFLSRPLQPRTNLTRHNFHHALDILLYSVYRSVVHHILSKAYPKQAGVGRSTEPKRETTLKPTEMPSRGGQSGTAFKKGKNIKYLFSNLVSRSKAESPPRV
jgi:hypothetical protein